MKFLFLFYRFVSYPEVMKADKLSYSAPSSLSTRMIMKSETPEEEENNSVTTANNAATAVHRDLVNNHKQMSQQQQLQLADKMCSSTPQSMAGLSGYYLNGIGMQSIARLGISIFLFQLLFFLYFERLLLYSFRFRIWKLYRSTDPWFSETRIVCCTSTV